MAIRLYNTLSGRKEEFIPHEPGTVKMYVCGPTVYDYFHIGNARAFVVFDTIRRYLEHKGYAVTFVQNFTDIDDKMIKRAAERGVTIGELAEEFIRAYRDDARALGIKEATVHPRATEHIPEIIALIQRLIETGHAYESNGDVYFKVLSFPGYGKLSKQRIDELEVGARVEVGEYKKHPLDFALWKAQKPGEPAWPSPWGAGRPGWHIECSVMAMKYLGESLDIHGGGADLVFPHHENEIAQSEAATGKAFARYWIHNAYLNVEGEKMSKSLGNIVVLRDLIRDYHPRAIRLFLLSAHYRNPLNLTEENLGAAMAGWRRLQSAFDGAGWVLRDFHPEARPSFELADAGEPFRHDARRLSEAIQRCEAEFEEAMDDDFNTALAQGALFDLASEINQYIHSPDFIPSHSDLALVARAHSMLRSMGGDILGVIESFRSEKDKPLDEREEVITELIRILLDVRHEARSAKDYRTSDMIRERLSKLGIVVEDTKSGPRWRWGQ